MIDLHTHTNESDGSLSPAELVDAAIAGGLQALAVTDHDTFAGYEIAAPVARERGFDLVRGLELATRFTLPSGANRAVHLLGYFLNAPPSARFLEWLSGLQAGRRERNLRLVDRLQSMGIQVTLAEVEAEGRSLAGRPHFAKILVRKGYATSSDQAFRKYIGETAPGYVERESPSLAAGIEYLLESKAIPVVAHPIRLGIRNHQQEDEAIRMMRDAGLRGIEVYHSDHGPADVARYLALAERYNLLITGGSDFHGANKPQIQLGRGIEGNVQVPFSVLSGLRAAASQS